MLGLAYNESKMQIVYLGFKLCEDCVHEQKNVYIEF